MQDEELLRYSRHILLDAIGVEGQARVISARALVVGAGGLGSPAAMYLACAGVGHITLVDNDTVDLTNLQRQIAHSTARVGQPKASSALQTLQALNPLIQVHAVLARADAAWLDATLPEVDVVLDCCDNFSTRHAINAACVRHRVPLVSGAALQFAGQISVFDPRHAPSPCYACIFPPNCPPPETRCSTMGVFAPLVGIIGSMQAAEALKIIIGCGTPLAGRLLLLDGLRMEWTEMQVARQAHCSVCGNPAAST
jgi:molybdopterin/thiamine biosynthesis adenylyltransferase